MDTRTKNHALSYLRDIGADLEGLRIFAAVAELRSVRHAASALGVPKSTASRKVTELEKSLGLRLLQRTPRTVVPTEEGTLLLRQLGPALMAIADARKSLFEAQGAPRGHLRFTAPQGLNEASFSAAITSFLSTHREVKIDIELTDRVVDLVTEGFDVALRAGRLPDSSLVARPLGTGQTFYYASPAYVKAHGSPRTPKDLEHHDCVEFTGSTARRGVWTFRQGSKRLEIPVKARIAANSFVLVREALVAGLGVGSLPSFYGASEAQAGRLVVVLEAFAPPKVPLQLVYPSARHLSPLVRAFVEHLATGLRLPGLER